MKTILIPLLFLIICFGCASSEKANEEWEQNFELYKGYVDNEDHINALSVAKELVRIAEENFRDSVFLADNYNLLGLAYRNTQEYEKAEHLFQKALPLAQGDVELATAIHRNLALVYINTGENSAAHASINAALKLLSASGEVDSSSLYQAKLTLADVLINMEDYEEALEQLTKVIEFGKSSGDNSLVMQGVSSFVKLSLYTGRPEEALKGIAKLKDYYKSNNRIISYADVFTQEGSAYFIKKNYSKAVACFSIAAEVKLEYLKDSSFIGLELYNIASSLEQKGDSIEASRYWQLYRKVNDNLPQQNL